MRLSNRVVSSAALGENSIMKFLSQKGIPREKSFFQTDFAIRNGERVLRAQSFEIDCLKQDSLPAEMKMRLRVRIRLEVVESSFNDLLRYFPF